MASAAEVERVRNDKTLWLPIAQRLYKHVEAETLHWRHVGFIEGLVGKPWLDKLSVPQGEWLLDARNEVELVSEYRQTGVKFLIRTCYENRLGLDGDGDRKWVAKLFESGRAFIQRDGAGRLYGLARELGVVDHD